jgi:hypothetical protein
MVIQSAPLSGSTGGRSVRHIDAGGGQQPLDVAVDGRLPGWIRFRTSSRQLAESMKSSRSDPTRSKEHSPRLAIFLLIVLGMQMPPEERHVEGAHPLPARKRGRLPRGLCYGAGEHSAKVRDGALSKLSQNPFVPPFMKLIMPAGGRLPDG